MLEGERDWEGEYKVNITGVTTLLLTSQIYQPYLHCQRTGKFEVRSAPCVPVQRPHSVSLHLDVLSCTVITICDSYLRIFSCFPRFHKWTQASDKAMESMITKKTKFDVHSEIAFHIHTFSKSSIILTINVLASGDFLSISIALCVA